MTTVLLAEDQALVRAGIRMVVDSQPDLTVVGEAANGEEAIHETKRLNPDVVLMDVRMPGLDGLAATRHILALPAPPKVILLTTYDVDEAALTALRAGAAGFLLKDAPPEDVLAAIRAVRAGAAALAPSTTRRLLPHLAPPINPTAARAVATLTARERDVLIAMARGHTNKEIAAALRISEGTTKTHITHILAKLDARDRSQAVVTAYGSGLVQPGTHGSGDISRPREEPR